MTVYVVITESYLEDHVIDCETFSTLEKAEEYYNKQVSIFMLDLAELGSHDYVVSDNEVSFEGYMAGDYANDHYTVTLKLREVQ